MTVPPSTIVESKPNWIQDAEAIAKADITRVEGTVKRVMGFTRHVGVLAWIAVVLSVVALLRTFR